jgi:hypothetical protein
VTVHSPLLSHYITCLGRVHLGSPDACSREVSVCEHGVPVGWNGGDVGLHCWKRLILWEALPALCFSLYCKTGDGRAQALEQLLFSGGYIVSIPVHSFSVPACAAELINCRGRSSLWEQALVRGLRPALVLYTLIL